MRSHKPGQFVAAVSVLMSIILTISCSALSATIVNMNDAKNGKIVITYGKKSIYLQGDPYFENGVLYLPLREILNKCGVTDENVHWKDGIIELEINEREDFDGNSDGFMRVSIADGSDVVSINGSKYRLGANVLVRDGRTWVPASLFWEIRQSDPDGMTLLAPLEIKARAQDGTECYVPSAASMEQIYSPETYYEEGEEVIIDTGDNQYVRHAYDENGSEKLVKRIVVDERGRVKWVVPVENQSLDTIVIPEEEQKNYIFVAWNSGGAVYSADGIPQQRSIAVMSLQRPGEALRTIAVIPPEYQIQKARLRVVEHAATVQQRVPQNYYSDEELAFVRTHAPDWEIEMNGFAAFHIKLMIETIRIPNAEEDTYTTLSAKEFLDEKNAISMQYGYDFSSYYGKRVFYKSMWLVQGEQGRYVYFLHDAEDPELALIGTWMEETDASFMTGSIWEMHRMASVFATFERGLSEYDKLFFEIVE